MTAVQWITRLTAAIFVVDSFCWRGKLPFVLWYQRSATSPVVWWGESAHCMVRHVPGVQRGTERGEERQGSARSAWLSWETSPLGSFFPFPEVSFHLSSLYAEFSNWLPSYRDCWKVASFLLSWQVNLITAALPIRERLSQLLSLPPSLWAKFRRCGAECFPGIQPGCCVW